MTVKKAIELIEQNNKHHQEDIKLYDKVLKKYEESNKTRPPMHEARKTAAGDIPRPSYNDQKNERDPDTVQQRYSQFAN